MRLWLLLVGSLSAEKLQFGRRQETWRSNFERSGEEVNEWDALGTASLNEEVVFLFGIKQVRLK